MDGLRLPQTYTYMIVKAFPRKIVLTKNPIIFNINFQNKKFNFLAKLLLALNHQTKA